MSEIGKIVPIIPWHSFAANPILPQYYWDCVSEEQRIKELAKRLHKLKSYIKYLAEWANRAREILLNHEIRLDALETKVANVLSFAERVKAELDAAIDAIYERIELEKQQSIERDEALDSRITEIYNELVELIDEKIDDLRAYVDSQDAAIREDLAAEVAARENADIGLQSQITINATNITNLNTRVDNEVADRIAADSALNAQVNAVNDKISTAATPDDRAPALSEVTQLVQAMSGTYVTKDADAHYFDSLVELQAGPWYHAGQAYTPTEHDYAVYSNSTEGTWWCQFDGSQWAVLYQVNESPFTPAQQAAIDSGITSAATVKLLYMLSRNNTQQVTVKPIEGGFQINVYESYLADTPPSETITRTSVLAGENITLDWQDNLPDSSVTISATGGGSGSDSEIRLNLPDGTTFGTFVLDSPTDVDVVFPQTYPHAYGLAAIDGETIVLNAGQELSVPTPTYDTTGVVKPGETMIVSPDGTIDATPATWDNAGVVSLNQLSSGMTVQPIPGTLYPAGTMVRISQLLTVPGYIIDTYQCRNAVFMLNSNTTWPSTSAAQVDILKNCNLIGGYIRGTNVLQDIDSAGILDRYNDGTGDIWRVTQGYGKRRYQYANGMAYVQVTAVVNSQHIEQVQDPIGLAVWESGSPGNPVSPARWTNNYYTATGGTNVLIKMPTEYTSRPSDRLHRAAEVFDGVDLIPLDSNVRHTFIDWQHDAPLGSEFNDQSNVLFTFGAWGPIIGITS